MAITIDKFASIIKDQIKNYSSNKIIPDYGKVISIGDGIAYVSGLNNVMLNEIVKFENGSFGIALNLEFDVVGVIVLGDFFNIKEGSIVTRTKKVISVPVGDELLSRIIDPLGNPIDNMGEINSKNFSEIEKVASGVMTRESVNSPLETGILIIDSMFPIGKGQRELIIGDRQTGKTTIAIDTIINQKGKNVKCVYVAIGQKNSSVAMIKKTLEEHGAMEYTTIVVADASDLPAVKYIAPFCGITIAEHWCQNGDDVLIVYDDLSKHAVAYRTLSLLLKRPPGREAYPGDIFYLHSRLLERSLKLNQKNGGGSITALPIIETQAGDISAYIPTNVISITDGQLFLMPNLFNSNQRPAIDAGLSVSRVGSAAQIKIIKQMCSSLKLDLALFRELESFVKFGSDLDPETKSTLDNGIKIMEMLKQPQHFMYSQIDESILLFAIKYKFTHWIPIEYIGDFKRYIINYFANSSCKQSLMEAQNFDDQLIDVFKKEFVTLIKSYVTKIKDYNWKNYKKLEI